ncbi:MAG: hypothetical protein AAF704_08145, partial [Cyanobacteria bacterium P01_D01_bin.123]
RCEWYRRCKSRTDKRGELSRTSDSTQQRRDRIWKCIESHLFFFQDHGEKLCKLCSLLVLISVPDALEKQFMMFNIYLFWQIESRKIPGDCKDYLFQIRTDGEAISGCGEGGVIGQKNHSSR